MVLIFDGNSEIGGLELSLLFDLFKAFDDTESSNNLFFLRRDIFSFKRVQHVLGYYLI